MAKKVKVIVPFYDRKEGVNRKVGEVFEVTPDRLAEVNACGKEQGGVPLVEEVRRRAPKEDSE